MGRGIAQVAAVAGCTVRWHDAVEGQVDAGVRFVHRMLDRLVEKEMLQPAECQAAKARLMPMSSLNDLADANVVIEAIIEDLDAKRALFRALEDIVAPDCILASNTSSIPIASLAAGARDPGRIAGLHFFNPVPLMKIVEVIAGLATRPEVTQSLEALGKRFGHFAPVVTDTPGFLVNHAGRGYGLESLRIESEGIADPFTIDRILCEMAGFRMGPFALFDLIGMDVAQAVMESIYTLYYHEPRYRPGLLTRQYRDAGLLGRKNGQGFYRYDNNGKPIPVDEKPIPDAAPVPVWLDIAHAPTRHAIEAVLQAQHYPLESADSPSAEAVCLVAPLGEDATSFALRRGLPPSRTVAIDTLLGLKERVCLMAPPVIEPPLLSAVAQGFAKAGHKVSLIHDSCGFVVQRVLANIVNVSCDIAQQRIASPADINKAVQLGLGYPMGPLAFGDAIGPERVLTLLNHLHAFYADPRYRPSPWLKRRALLGVSLSTPELAL